jgi:long-chain acyl-CoA synthetase
MLAGLVVSGVYPTDSAEQLEFLCADSHSKILIVEDDEQLDKALQVRERLPALVKIIVIDMEGLRDLNDPQIISLQALEALGQSHDEQHPALFASR